MCREKVPQENKLEYAGKVRREGPENNNGGWGNHLPWTEIGVNGKSGTTLNGKLL